MGLEGSPYGWHVEAVIPYYKPNKPQDTHQIGLCKKVRGIALLLLNQVNGLGEEAKTCSEKKTQQIFFLLLFIIVWKQQHVTVVCWV